MFSPKTKFSTKTMFSPKLCFPQKICFLQKNIFSPKKTWFHLKTCFQKKRGFHKRNVFMKNTCFHQKKWDQMRLKINKVNKRYIMVLTFGLVFSSVSPFLPVSFSFFPFFPFLHQVNSSNLPPEVWHWLPWPCFRLPLFLVPA